MLEKPFPHGSPPSPRNFGELSRARRRLKLEAPSGPPGFFRRVRLGEDGEDLGKFELLATSAVS